MLEKYYVSSNMVHNLNSPSARCVNGCTINMFSRSRNPVISGNQCAVVESRQYRH